MTNRQPGHALNRAEVRANSRFDSCDGGQLLHDLEQFLDNQADADDGRPNEAMRLLIEVRAIAKEKDAQQGAGADSASRQSSRTEHLTNPASDWARAKAFGAITSHPDCFLDDYPLTDLIETIAAALDQARTFGADEWRGHLMAVVHTAGGEVEGQPTQSINVLQRIRELLEKEQASEGWQALAKAAVSARIQK